MVYILEDSLAEVVDILFTVNGSEKKEKNIICFRCLHISRSKVNLFNLCTRTHTYIIL